MNCLKHVLTDKIMRKFSEQMKAKYHSDSHGNWQFNSGHGDYYYWTGNNIFNFVVRALKNNIVRFETHIYYAKKTVSVDVYNHFITFLQKENVDLIVTQNHPGFYDIKPTGKISENFLSILNKIGYYTLEWDGKISYHDKRIENKYDLFFDYIKMEMVMNKQVFSGQFGKYTYEKVYTFTSLVDAEKFVAKQIEFKKETLVKEKEFLSIIQSFDKTAYFKEKDLFYYIYGKTYPLYIKRLSEGYKGKVGRKYIQNKDLDILTTKMKEELKSYLIKNRVAATVQGRASNFIETFLFEIFGKQKKVTSFSKVFDTSFTEGELNLYLKDRVHKIKKVVLSESEASSIKKVLRENGKRHQIKFVYKYDDLYVLISASKVHILKASECNI